MKSFIALAFVAAASASEHGAKFMQFITEFGKNYETVQEFNFRFEQWAKKEMLIVEHNAAGESFTLGHNKMSDWSDWQYKAILTAQVIPESEKNYVVLNENAVPNSVDWISAGAVNAIKDQGQCGSCWAFSAVGALEGAVKIKSGALPSYAEQQLVDCSTANYGCNGGWQYQAFNYYKTNFAVLESNYKYTAADGTCAYASKAQTTTKTTGYVNVTASNVTQMKAAVAKTPISVTIEADTSVFQSYSSGIFNSTKCGTNLDHAVMVVGWGTAAGVDYWMLRNSWGTSWGEKGYMRVQIVDGNGICGVQMQTLYPTL